MSTRRHFLEIAALSALGAGRACAANDRIAIGVVGVGSRGSAVMNGFLGLPDVRIAAVCDVDRYHYREHTTRKGNPYGLDPAKLRVDQKYGDEGCAAYHDYRELIARDDLDAVIVATPDHWHAKIAMEAIESGKDVYCEKPVTHTFAEGKALHEAVAKRGAVFQVGSQQRSMPEFRRAVELVRNGVLGKLTKVEIGLPPGYETAMGSTEVETPPETLDYPAWCGPSPQLPYMRARHHRWWRGHSAFGGGTLMDWIGHHNDIASWGGGFEKSGPVSLQATRWSREHALDVYDTPVDYAIECKYPGGLEWTIDCQFAAGTKWIGENGWIHVERGALTASDTAWVGDDFEIGGEFKITQPERHDQNFIDCLRSRDACIAPAEEGHRSITPGHLARASAALGARKIVWDAKNETAVGDPEVQALLDA